MILLDTNIILRLSQTADPFYAIASAAVATLIGRGEQLRIVPQTLYEFWVVATRPKSSNGFGLSTATCDAEMSRLITAFPVLPDPKTLFIAWKALVVAHDCKGKVAHDARFVAAMQAHGVTRLLTFNGPDFARYPGVVVLDPAAVATAP